MQIAARSFLVLSLMACLACADEEAPRPGGDLVE